MTESDPSTNHNERDPMLRPMQDVIETLMGQAVPVAAAEAIGITATAAASVDAEAATTPSIPDVINERPKPAHWDELVEFAGTLPIFKHIDKYGAKYEDASVDALRAKLEELLDDEALDECRYYSIGNILCGVARGMHDPKQRPQVLAAIARRLLAEWALEGSADPRGLMPKDIIGTRPSAAFSAMIGTFASELPPHMQLLNDLLDWHAAERRTSLRDGGSPASYAYLSKEGPRNDSHYKAGNSAQRVGQVTAAATARVLRIVLTLRGRYLKKNDPGFPEDPTALQIINRTDMDDINLIPVAQRAAAMRLDELRGLETNRYITLDKHGRAVFNSKKLPHTRDLNPPATGPDGPIPSLLHTRRLRCPALFVEGLIPGMMGCLIEGIELADVRLREERERTEDF